MDILKKHWAIILLAIVLLGGAFYWYGYRPSQIKKDCYSSSIHMAAQRGNSGSEDYDTFYKWCLDEAGL